MSAAGTAFWLGSGWVAYTYFGYPAVLRLLPSRSGDQDATTGPPPAVTVLVAAHDEEAVIARKLDELLALDYPAPLQVIVATDGSTDRTPEIVRDYASRGVELSHRAERAGKTAAITRAFPLVRHGIVAFSDANNRWEPGALSALVAPFADDRVGAVTGAKYVDGGPDALETSESLYWRYESYIKWHESRLGTCTAVVGEIWAVRAELLEPIPHDVINDDFWLAMRVARRGYQVKYAPEARSWEATSASARDEVARRTRIVAGRFQAMSRARALLTIRRPVVLWQVCSHKFARALVPFAMVLALASNAVAVVSGRARRPVRDLGGPLGRILLAGQVVFYASGALRGRAPRNAAVRRLLAVHAYLLDGNWAALVGAYRHLRGSQGSSWQRVERAEPRHEAGTHRG